MIVKALIACNLLVWLLLVLDAAVVALVVGILGFIANMVTLFVNHQQNKRLDNMKENQKEIVNKQDKMATDMDGKMTQLLAANKRADIAESAAATRVEIKAEQVVEDAKLDKPMPVIVVETADVNIVKDETKNEPVKVVVTKPADVNIVKDKTKEK